MFEYRVPGVYRQEVTQRIRPALPTGVPGFVGFADARSEDAAANSPVLLHRQADFDARFIGGADGYLADAVAGFFSNGGVRCYVVRADPNVEPERALVDAMESLGPFDDIDLVAVPDAMTLPRRYDEGVEMLDDGITRVQRAMLSHCAAHRGRFAILDARSGIIASKAIDQRSALVRGMEEPVNGALYYPWLKLNGGRLAPPSGHVAGIYARTDASAGYFKAPANEEVHGVVDLEVPIGNTEQDKLNPGGVNCLRAFPGRGIRVWGARTISRDPNWRYVNVRRLFLTLGRWIDLNMAWVSFEPNTSMLWVRITRELTGFLDGLWRAGALAGKTREEAYYVKCDSEANPSEVREAGQAITEVGLAPGSPGEFVVVRIVHHTAAEPR
ncbi:MAG TPA: phage tail sheath subtilisin-like domain-containing protein [Blastocatellia bacterium]|nr:phage tail sheath subtilisin-like domain-containing protein [Blastocatellia bacterium]